MREKVREIGCVRGREYQKTVAGRLVVSIWRISSLREREREREKNDKRMCTLRCKR